MPHVKKWGTKVQPDITMIKLIFNQKFKHMGESWCIPVLWSCLHPTPVCVIPYASPSTSVPFSCLSPACGFCICNLASACGYNPFLTKAAITNTLTTFKNQISGLYYRVEPPLSIDASAHVSSLNAKCGTFIASSWLAFLLNIFCPASCCLTSSIFLIFPRNPFHLFHWLFLKYYSNVMLSL